MVTNGWDGRDVPFLPDGILEKEITPESIRAEHGNVPDDLVEFIMKDALRVFAILSLTIDTPEIIVKAMGLILKKREKLNDTKLPIPRCPPEPEDGEEDDYVLYDVDEDDEVFSRMRIENFYDKQWSVLSPVISNSSERYLKDDCTSQHIMPFTSHEDMQAHGAFSQIFKVTIHPNHFEDALGHWVGFLPLNAAS
jgi:hypothetical protein